MRLGPEVSCQRPGRTRPTALARDFGQNLAAAHGRGTAVRGGHRTTSPPLPATCPQGQLDGADGPSRAWRSLLRRADRVTAAHVVIETGRGAQHVVSSVAVHPDAQL